MDQSLEEKESMFREEEMLVDKTLGFPLAYAKLCRDPTLGSPYIRGPPFTFIPYILDARDALGAKQMNQMFPIVDSDSKPIINPKKYADMLWKRLNHLGNAGFDPDMFRVDPYGNVLYFHADSASPLAWDIDHRFPYSRGGKTVPSNLRILQKQVCRKKQNSLEFLLPWWDLQLGVSVNQFLTIFASQSSDFRQRAFSLLFSETDSGELKDSQVCTYHAFPLPFEEKKRQVGLAPAAIVQSNRDLDAQFLKGLNLHGQRWRKIPGDEQDHQTMMNAIEKFHSGMHVESETADLKNRRALSSEMQKVRETTEKTETEMHRLDGELIELKKRNEEERIALQELETTLVKRKRRVEKARQLSEAQSSYRALLEKMIRDAMHQNVVYKEQLRLNQAATTALMARLETQRAACESSERELQKRFKQRDEVEKKIRSDWESARKRTRMEDARQSEERLNKTGETSKTVRRSKRASSQKELRLFLEEDRNTHEAGIPINELNEKDNEMELQKQKGESNFFFDDLEECKHRLENRFKNLAGDENKPNGQDCLNTTLSSLPRDEDETEEDYRRKIGKLNVDNWLQKLLENTEDCCFDENPGQGNAEKGNENTNSGTEEPDRKSNPRNTQEIKILKQRSREEVEFKKSSSDEVLGEIGNMVLQSEGGGDVEGNGGVVADRRHIQRHGREIRKNSEKNNEGLVNEADKLSRKSLDDANVGSVRNLKNRGYASTPASPFSDMMMSMKKDIEKRMGKKKIKNSDDDNDENMYEENQMNDIFKAIKTRLHPKKAGVEGA